MAGRIINRKVKFEQLAPPTDFLTSTDGNNNAVDTLGFNEGLILIDKGIVDDVTLNIDIQHSDVADSGFATIPTPVNTQINPRLLTFVNADDNKVSVAYLDLTALKRYIKPVDTLNANSALYGISVILLGPEAAPTSSTFETDAT